jgi:tRNA-2-methylthio-N6-dimethylallyladenosine synthase
MNDRDGNDNKSEDVANINTNINIDTGTDTNNNTNCGGNFNGGNAADKAKLKFHIITFGCQMNAADSEMIAGTLMKMGYEKTGSKAEADLVLINTCAVRAKPEAKVYSHLGDLVKLRDVKPSLMIGICGCVAQKERENIIKQFPYVDLVFGPQSIGELPRLIALADKAIAKKLIKLAQMKKQAGVKSDLKMKRKFKGAGIYGDFESMGDDLPEKDVSRESGFKAYITIMRGCDNFCSYCVVPYTRGREKSRPFELIVKEAEELVRTGYKEITLLGQNVNSYRGAGGETFADLLERIDAIEGRFYIRFMTSHPKDLSERLIEVMASARHIAPHVHLPFQSGSTRILELMNRRYSRGHYIELIDKIKSKIKGVTLTTDVITGFPQETEEDFNETVSLLNYVKYDSAFLFFYSEREGTAALSIEGALPLKTRLERLERLVQLQTEITFDINRSMKGEIHEGIVESASPKSEKELSIRTYDNHVVIAKAPDESKNYIGEFVKVKITQGFNFVLKGEII